MGRPSSDLFFTFFSEQVTFHLAETFKCCLKIRDNKHFLGMRLSLSVIAIYNPQNGVILATRRRLIADLATRSGAAFQRRYHFWLA
jgi:hypothetical protein